MSEAVDSIPAPPALDAPILDWCAWYLAVLPGAKLMRVHGINYGGAGDAVDEIGTCRCGEPKCAAAGKHPILAKYQLNAVGDMDAARDMFAGKSDNMGLMPCSKYLIMDFDGTNETSWFRELWAKDGQYWPDTLRFGTGRDGGEHYVFRLAPHHDPTKLRSGKFMARDSSIDMRCANGFVVCAPSMHRGGRRYTVLRPVPAAMLPDWVYDLAIKPLRSKLVVPADVAERIYVVGGPDDKRIQRARAYLAKIDPAISGQHGHDTLFNAILKLRSFDLTPEEIEALILSDYNPRCVPPWSLKEIRHKIHDAFKVNVRSRLDTHTWEGAVYPSSDDSNRGTGGNGGGGDGGAGGDSGGGSGGSGGGGGGNDGGGAAVSGGDNPYVKPDPNDMSWIVRLKADDNWLTGLRKSRTGKPTNEPVNITRIFQAWGGFEMNEMDDYVYHHGKLVTDLDIKSMRTRIFSEQFGMTVSIKDITDMLLEAASKRRYHPIKDVVDREPWDGVPRLGQIMRRCLGYHQDLQSRLLAKTVIAYMARVYNPGCQVDHCCVLVGLQGKRKSSFWRSLGCGYHVDTAIDIKNKDAVLQLHAASLYEFGEIDKVTLDTSRSAGDIKNFITQQYDVIRKPYGTTVEKIPRHNILVGSTNKEKYLLDETGSRRFWSILTPHRVDISFLEENKQQILAEGKAMWVARVELGRQGLDDDEIPDDNRWWLLAKEEANLSALTTLKYREVSAWEADVDEYLAREYNKFGTAAFVRVGDILENILGIPKAHFRQGGNDKFVCGILSSRGCVYDANSRSWRLVHYGRIQASLRADQADSISCGATLDSADAAD